IKSLKDISHVLANTFKDLYTKSIIGKDILSNLIKTKNERSSYHDRYVKELQQAHTEYSLYIKEADTLESHIIEARVRAAAAESQACERMKEEMGELNDHQSLLTVESAFSWCVDNDLLKMNNLISPKDYLTKEKPHVKDDGYSLIPGPEKSVLRLHALCIVSTVIMFQKPNRTKPRPKWKGEPSAKDREEGREKLQKLKEQHSFLRNPRFLPPSAQQGGTSLIRPRTKHTLPKPVPALIAHFSSDDLVPIFLAKPSVVVFTDYSVGHVYETTLELKNLTSASRHVRLIPPTTPYFSIGLGRFPGDGGVVAPGMSCKYTVRFAPGSLGNYEDFIVVETQAEHIFVVPIAAIRPPPVLTLPRVLDCGYCLIGGVKFVEFFCQNVGLSSGTFCIIPKNKWSFFAEQAPFAISPSIFVLQPGEATAVEVVFFPTTAEKSCQAFTVACDNCQVKDVSIEGEGQLIALELVSVSGQNDPPVLGEVHDLSAEHFIRFSPCNPHSVQQKKLIIRNNVHLELPYHWQIMKPNLRPLLPGEIPEPSHIQFHLATDDVFHVSPMAGVLSPCQEVEFLLTFSPNELKDYHSVCHLVLRDVPELPPESTEDGILQPVRTGSKVSDVIVMEIEVKGSTVPYQVLLDPYAVIIPGDLFICTTTRRQFKMWNHSKTGIFFQWERMSSSSHIIEVEPSTGRIEENECFDFDLIVTGGKPEKVVSSLVCHIEHRQEPVTLAVEVSFKGPTVTLSVPSVDFGLLKLGEQTHTTLLLTNITQLEANWTLKEKCNNQQDTQVFTDAFKHIFLNISLYLLCLDLIVQSPQVCLLNCELLLSDLYIGVPANATVTLFNQTLLPTDFSWILQGKQAELCTASFQPSSGTLGPNASMDVTVTFTSNTDVELTELAALCEVLGMNSPLALGIVASKTKNLSVSYSSTQDDERPSTLLLDFDDVVLKQAVTKQLLITNESAIPAPFTIEAEYFNCHALKVRFKLHVQNRLKFVNSLLAHGKGAAFFVLPHCGLLGPFESQSVDITAYSDMWGEYRDLLLCKVIPAKGSSTIHVSFTPFTLSGSVYESKCVGLALGFMSLDSEVTSTLHNNAISISNHEKIQAAAHSDAAKTPLLLCFLVVCEFDTTQTFQLKNNSEMALHFQLETQPPFLVLKPQPQAFTSTSSNLPSGDSQSLVLKPQHSMQVRPGEYLPLPAEEAEVPAEPPDSLHLFLLLSVQTVPLCAHLDLATIRLSTDSIDFGFCYVGQTQTVEVNLYSHGAHTYWKSVTESDVFRVTPDFGLLRSKGLHVTSYSQCLQISFTPRYQTTDHRKKKCYI
uniref:DLEC1 cilia and flagella associated protein n=1 Tax=Labrus bergylta TaxID=56723 RepID=A0A3Q3G0Z0_9LABR